jgi:hypothetical protein
MNAAGKRTKRKLPGRCARPNTRPGCPAGCLPRRRRRRGSRGRPPARSRGRRWAPPRRPRPAPSSKPSRRRSPKAVLPHAASPSARGATCGCKPKCSPVRTAARRSP